MSTGAAHDPCAEAVANLYALLDEELTDDLRQRVQQHFNECVNCLPLYRFEHSFARFLKARRLAQTASADLRQRVFEAMILDRHSENGD